MRKIAILLIISMVISVGFLSGCNEQKATENVPYEQQDSDGDGYLNKVDDFPDNSQFHEKIIVDELKLTVDDPWTTKELTPIISSDVKRLIIGIYTSGNDIEVELFTQSQGDINIHSAWKYYFNGMSDYEQNEHPYDLHSGEQFNKLVVTNPQIYVQFGVDITIYAVR